MISVRTSVFSFRETYFRLVGLFDWGYARTQFLLSVSRNRYGFTLARYQNEKYATDPALLGRDIGGGGGGGWGGGCRCATSWCDLDLTFVLAVVTLTYKILSGLYLESRKV